MLKDENHCLLSRCLELEREVKCASTQAQNLGGFVEQIGNLGDENDWLSSRCQELEQELQCASVVTTHCVQDLAGDLESSQTNNAKAHTMTKTLWMKNHDLRVKANELVCNLRCCSLLLTSQSALSEQFIQLAAKNEEKFETLGMIWDAQVKDDAFYELTEGAICLASKIRKEYDAKFAALNKDLNQKILLNGELLRQMDAVMKDNNKLIKELQGTNALVVSSVRNEIKQEQLSKETWNREKRDLATSIDGLKKENERLQDSLSSLSASLRNEHKHELNVKKKANLRLREMIDGTSREQEEAYNDCKVFQEEICLLRQSLDESKGHVHKLPHS
jgi:hypothetical protein